MQEKEGEGNKRKLTTVLVFRLRDLGRCGCGGGRHCVCDGEGRHFRWLVRLCGFGIGGLVGLMRLEKLNLELVELVVCGKLRCWN